MSTEKRQRRDGLFLLCLAALLVLRFPIMLLPEYGLSPLTKESSLTVFQIGTYFFTSVMILLKRDCLEIYHIDRFALAFLVFAPLGCFVTQGILLQGWENLPLSTYMNAVQALLFGLALLIWRPTLPRRDAKSMWKWVGLAFLTALLWSVISGYIIHFQKNVPPEAAVYLPKQAEKVFLLIFTQLSTAAALEEPLFRGFLWGVLRDRGWKEPWIWLFQTLLFMLGHLFYLGTANLSFFLIVPFGALLLGLIAWKSRSIGTSMLVHGIGNSLAGNFFFLLFR